MNIIELKKINKFFGENANRVHVLKDVNFSVESSLFFYATNIFLYH